MSRSSQRFNFRSVRSVDQIVAVDSRCMHVSNEFVLSNLCEYRRMSYTGIAKD